MSDAFICDALRTPIGRCIPGSASVRPDRRAAILFSRPLPRKPSPVAWTIEEAIMESANQVGEGNRNFARMAALPGRTGEKMTSATVDLLCGSGMGAMRIVSCAVKSGENHPLIAGEHGKH